MLSLTRTDTGQVLDFSKETYSQLQLKGVVRKRLYRRRGHFTQLQLSVRLGSFQTASWPLP